MSEVDDIKALLKLCNQAERREIFDMLRAEFPIHALETKLNIPAEAILEAIDRASDLTLRGVRGVIAEIAFKLNVAHMLKGWISQELQGDFPYDFLLRDRLGDIRVQVKMQRLKSGVPMMASQGYKRLPPNMYVVETQRTRGGKDHKTGEDTRPYKFGEFDVLAVSMHPSTREWSSFMYTVADWLLPRPENKALMLKFQPVAKTPNHAWTDTIETCIAWFRSEQKKTILD